MKKIISIIILSFWLLPSAGAFSRSNFDTPESFVADPETGAYYVSNLNGGALDKDGNGYISKISANGNLVIQKFIGGKADENAMNAPKGILLLGNELWVTDIDVVRIFKKETAKLVRVIDLSSFEVKYLKDLTADSKGMVYVSDMQGDQILKIDPSNNYKAAIYHRGSELGNPNGLMYNPKSQGLMVASFKSGQILEIDRNGRLHVLKKGLSGLAGIDYDNNGNVYVASLDKGEIYKIPYLGRGALSVFQSNLTGPSDISINRRHKELLIPSYTGNTVTTVYLIEKDGAKRTKTPGGDAPSA